MMTIIKTRGRDQAIQPMRETEYDQDIELNTIPNSQMSANISQTSYTEQNSSLGMNITMITGLDPINERYRIPFLQIN